MEFLFKKEVNIKYIYTYKEENNEIRDEQTIYTKKRFGGVVVLHEITNTTSIPYFKSDNKMGF